jgi:hypothetical protein
MRKAYDRMEGLEFEAYCARLLKRNGFRHVTVTRGSSDQGIDILAYKNRKKYGIQCKCYSYPVGNKSVQEAYAGMKYYECDLAAVLTNQHFTDSAKMLSQKTEVLLWDRQVLEELRKCKKNSFFTVLGALGSILGAALSLFLLVSEPLPSLLQYPGFFEIAFSVLLAFSGLFLALEKGNFSLSFLAALFSGSSLLIGLFFQNNLGGLGFLPLPLFFLSFLRTKKLRSRSQIF